MSFMTPRRFVADAYDWKLMDGKTDLEKRLNSYLTARFIFSRDVPSDECLSEARDVIRLVRAELKFQREEWSLR